MTLKTRPFWIQMLSEYNTNSEVAAMMDQLTIVVFPVLNVDGYAYTWTDVRVKNITLRSTFCYMLFGANLMLQRYRIACGERQERIAAKGASEWTPTGTLTPTGADLVLRQTHALILSTVRRSHLRN